MITADIYPEYDSAVPAHSEILILELCRMREKKSNCLVKDDVSSFTFSMSE